jgi:hypothetical protein
MQMFPISRQNTFYNPATVGKNPPTQKGLKVFIQQHLYAFVNKIK